MGVLMPPDHKNAVRQFFGDSVKPRPIRYVSLGIGMVLGVLIGLIPIRFPASEPSLWVSAADR